MSSLRTNFADLLTPGFRQIFNDKFKEMPMVMDKLYHVDTSEKDSEKDSAVSGFGYAVQTGEGGAIQYEDPVLGFNTTYVHLKYTKGFKVSREMYDDFFMSILFYFSLLFFNFLSTSALFFLKLYNGYYLILFYLFVSFIVEYIWTSGEFLPVLILLVIFTLEITAVSFVLLAGLPWRPPSPSRPPS